jgi:hypothetical protein
MLLQNPLVDGSSLSEVFRPLTKNNVLVAVLEDAIKCLRVREDPALKAVRPE